MAAAASHATSTETTAFTGTAVVVADERRSRSARVWALAAMPVVVLFGLLDELVPAATITATAVVLVGTILVGPGEQRRTAAAQPHP